jgi:putative nucleotidyltransferase with HDIG domain
MRVGGVFFMKTIEIQVDQCGEGDIIAVDMFNHNGVKLLSANTTINGFIRNRLIELGFETVIVYDPPIRQNESQFQYKRAVNSYRKNIVTVKYVITEIAAGKKLNYEKLIGLTEMLAENIELNDSVVLNCVNDLRNTDEYTYTHSINVGIYSMLIAKWMNLPKADVNRVLIAGVLHDIGKTKIPSTLLNKKEPLMNWEFSYIKNHPIYGYKILEDNKYIDNDIKEAVIYHHERLNSKGYPFGIYPDKLFPRIIAIADVYDAITSDRAYKKGKSPFNAFHVFQTESVGMFDTYITNLFLSYVSTYLIGAEVTLPNGDKGKILFVSPQDMTQPIISVNSNIIDITDLDYVKVSARF